MNHLLILLNFLTIFLIVSCGQDNGWDNSRKLPFDDFNTADNKREELDSTETNSRDFSIDRLMWQKPDEVIKELGDVSQKTVVDLGAGSGYFSFKLLPLAKKVIAIDIDPKAIQFLNSSKINLLSDELKEKLETRLAKFNDPLIKENEADDVLIVNTYMYIENRIAYLKKLKKGLKKDGQILIIDFKKRNIPVGPNSNSKVALSTVEKELMYAGFIDIHSDDQTLKYQYIIKAKNQK